MRTSSFLKQPRTDQHAELDLFVTHLNNVYLAAFEDNDKRSASPESHAFLEGKLQRLLSSGDKAIRLYGTKVKNHPLMTRELFNFFLDELGSQSNILIESAEHSRRTHMLFLVPVIMDISNEHHKADLLIPKTIRKKIESAFKGFSILSHGKAQLHSGLMTAETALISFERQYKILQKIASRPGKTQDASFTQSWKELNPTLATPTAPQIRFVAISLLDCREDSSTIFDQKKNEAFCKYVAQALCQLAPVFEISNPAPYYEGLMRGIMLFNMHSLCDWISKMQNTPDQLSFSIERDIDPDINDPFADEIVYVCMHKANSGVVVDREILQSFIDRPIDQYDLDFYEDVLKACGVMPSDKYNRNIGTVH